MAMGKNKKNRREKLLGILLGEEGCNLRNLILFIILSGCHKICKLMRKVVKENNKIESFTLLFLH